MNHTPPQAPAAENRVLVLAPMGRDGAVICRSLQEAGIAAVECRDFEGLRDHMSEGVGAAIIAAEALSPERVTALAAALAAQPPWSDLPLLILAPTTTSMRAMEDLLARLGPTGTATVLERPVHIFSMVTAVQMALRSRGRQYQVRDQLAQSERYAASLRESETRFRELADAMPLIVWSARPDGYIDYYNKRWYEFTGLVGGFGDASWMPILHHDDLERCLRTYYSAIHSGEPYEIEYRFKDRLSGGYRWHLGRAIAVRDESGTIRRWLGTCIDIQQIVEARETLARGREQLELLVAERTRELEESHRRLRTSERMASLGTLSAGLGHDMGNLLLPVRVRLDSLDAAGLDPELQEDVSAIRRAAEYLQRLANGLRLLAIDPGEVERRDESTDPLAWWSDVEGLLRNVLPRAVTLEHCLPAAPPHVRMAPSALTQAVFNLVQNAGEAMRAKGSGHVLVSLADGRTPGTVRLSVSDDGPGMPPDVRARCLEPFYSTKPRAISTGLGLVLVGGLVQAAGGSVELESEPGKGTTFTLNLPIAVRPSGEAAPKPLAVVSLADPRLRAFVASVLSVLDLEVAEEHPGMPQGDGRTAARLWVLDGRNGSLEAARRFVQEGADRGVILLDEADEAASDRLMALGRSPSPEAIRRALVRAARGCRRTHQEA